MTNYTTTTTTANTNLATSTFSKAKRDWFKATEGNTPAPPPQMFNIRSAS